MKRYLNSINKCCNYHISTAAIVNGGVDLGDDSFYGSNAVSKEYITIKKESFIKANSIQK